MFPKQLVVCRLVIGCHKCLEHEHFRPDNVYTEKLLRHFGERFHADAVGDVLKHDPALQAMEVLVQALMVVRHKLGTALQALMDGGATGNDFAFHPAGRQHQIKGPLDSGFLRPHLFLDAADEVLTLVHSALWADSWNLNLFLRGPLRGAVGAYVPRLITSPSS